jgi:hypothetical protein
MSVTAPVPRKRTVSRRNRVLNHENITYGLPEHEYAANFRFCAKCPRGVFRVPITSSVQSQCAMNFAESPSRIINVT